MPRNKHTCPAGHALLGICFYLSSLPSLRAIFVNALAGSVPSNQEPIWVGCFLPQPQPPSSQLAKSQSSVSVLFLSLFSSHHSVGSWKPVHILLLFTHQPSVIHLLHHPKTVVAEDSHSFPVAQARGHLAARLFLSCWCLTSVATYSTVKHSCLGPVVPHWHLNWTSSTSLVCSSSGLLAWVLVFSRPEHILNQTPPPSDAFFSEVPILFLCGWLLDQLLRVPTHIWKPIKWVTQVTSSYGEGLILIWEGSSLI